MTRRLEEIEIRVKALEKENKDTHFNNSQLSNDLGKARSRETLLEDFLLKTLSFFST